MCAKNFAFKGIIKDKFGKIRDHTIKIMIFKLSFVA